MRLGPAAIPIDVEATGTRHTALPCICQEVSLHEFVQADGHRSISDSVVVLRGWSTFQVNELGVFRVVGERPAPTE